MPDFQEMAACIYWDMLYLSWLKTRKIVLTGTFLVAFKLPCVFVTAITTKAILAECGFTVSVLEALPP
jgi:hypothetical protein